MDLTTVQFKRFPTPEVQRLIKAFDGLESQHEFKDGKIKQIPKRLSEAFTMHVLGCTEEEAAELHRELVEKGYFLADRMIPTTEGMALCIANSLPRITRAQAEEIVDRLVEATEGQNARPDARIFIERVQIFGSYVSERPDLGDIDVFVTMPLIDDLQPEDLDEMDEIGAALKEVSPYVSLHDETDATAASAEKITVYRRSTTS